MSVFQVSVEPDAGVEIATPARPTSVDIVYMRAIEGVSGVDGSRASTAVQETQRVALDDRLRGAFALADPAPSSRIDLFFLAGNGAARLTKSTTASGDAARIALSKEDVAKITAADPQPAETTPAVQRRAHFVPSSAVRVPFEASKLQIAPVTVAQGGWARLALDRLFLADAPITAAVPWVAADWQQLGDVAWMPTHVAIDGQFAFAVPQGAGDAWLWWLTGPLPAIGIVLDDLASVRVVRIGVPLPPFSGAAPTGDAPGRVPADVTEAEVASNPGIYTEDPGEFCRPFRNPERVLGERSFFVVMRAEQPVISSESSVIVDPLPTLDYVVSPTVAAPSVGLAPISRDVGAAATRAAATAVLSRSTDPVFTRNILPPPYVDMLRRFNRGRGEMSASNPVQWESDVSRYQATTVARGHILEYRMRWRSNGYSLGTVAKTLTLAPRQVRRIQKIEWSRTEAARRQEATRFSERASDRLQREREYDDSVQANLSEWSRGSSRSSTTAGAVGAGFAAGGFVIGGGGAKSNATSSSEQEGGRRTSAAEEQRLRDSIQRYGDSLRQLESVVVNEVTQEETVTGTTEVVRNQNYAHSLTVIYYQILRHLKIETAIAGVRECLFVPFPIMPFTVARAYRWRDLIRAGLREPRHATAIESLRDVLTNFASSTVPSGRRSDQPIQYIYGSLFVNLAIDRPRDAADGAFDALAWARVQPFLGAPALSIFTRLKALAEAQRDAAFQRDHAPTIAATWVNSLELDAGGVKLRADFTLATRYQFNGIVRIDFSVANPSGQQPVTRELLAGIRVKATRDLPPGSVASLRSVSYTYQTDHFERSVSASQGAGDLVVVETGALDPAGATSGTIPDLWERQDIRAEMIESVRGLVEHLNDHVEYYHKVIWWGMDRDRLFMLIDGFHVPGTNGVSIASIVERDPIAIIGNAIVFRVSAGAFLGIGAITTPAQLRNHYVALDAPSDPILVSLPTDGLYAQAVMDECAALEEHFGNIDWALNDPDPELGTIAPELLTTRRAEPPATQPTPFPQTLINLQNAPAAPDPTGLAGALQTVANANAFRDMAGLAGTQANAAAGFQAAATLASSFGAQAAALKLAETADKAHTTQTADQKLATVQRAVDKKLTTPEEAQKQASEILKGLTPTPASRPDPAAVLSQPIFQSASSLKATTPEFHLEALLDTTGGIGGGGGGSTGINVGPFPPVPALVFKFNDQKMTDAMVPVVVSSATQLCSAVVDLTGAPANPPYAGINDDEMVFTGSLMKICAVYAAFALRAQVQDFVDEAAKKGLPVVAPGIIAEIERAWKTKVAGLFPGRPKFAFGTTSDISFPKLAEIFTFGAGGSVEFTRGSPPLTDAEIDDIGRADGAPQGKFDEALRLTTRWSSNLAASKLILALGYFYINGLLADGEFFKGQTGLWLSADYDSHDWVATLQELNTNAAGQPLTPRWATAQKRQLSNITSTARQLARLMTLMARGQLVDATASKDMRDLLEAARTGVGSYLETALDDAGRVPIDGLKGKIGFGDDSSSHDCGIVERKVGGKSLRYAVVGLGSLAAANRKDLSDMFVLLDEAIVTRNA